MSKAFLDTNILGYACDLDAAEKRPLARDLIRQLTTRSAACISTQVLQEFYVTATKKLGIQPLDAKDVIQSFRNMETVAINPGDIDHAIDGSILWQVSFWDALIIAAASKARCEILYTEDLNDGQVYGDVRVCNPFLPGNASQPR